MIKSTSLFPNGDAQIVVSGGEEIFLNWVSRNSSEILSLIDTCGAILFRGFDVPNGVEASATLMQILFGGAIDYEFYSTPRTKVGDGTFTTTEYPQSQRISLHSEMTYGSKWPRYIAFVCVAAAPIGGETPIADLHEVSRHIGSEILEEFAEKRVTYVRNYRAHIDLPWQTVFQTESRNAVEQFCDGRGIEVKWLEGDGLRTSHQAQGAITSPSSGALLWFNQAHVFHPSSLPFAIRQALERSFKPEELPRNCFMSHNELIDESKLDAVRTAMDRCERKFTWQPGDVLLLDNLRYMHGRAPFSGARKVLVSMASLIDESLIPSRSQ